jgi:hypothetical protein
MSASNFFESLVARGCTFQPIGDRLRVMAPPHVLSADDRALIRTHAEAILTLLRTLPQPAVDFMEPTPETSPHRRLVRALEQWFRLAELGATTPPEAVEAVHREIMELLDEVGLPVVDGEASA